MNKIFNKFAVAAAFCMASSFAGSAHAQDAMMSDNAMGNEPMTTMSSTAMAPVPSATVVRRYLDSGGNLSSVDVRFSSGTGVGETRQLRIMPALVTTSEAAAPYRLGRTLTIGISDSGVRVPASFDPDASSDMMRGVVRPVGNTTNGMPMYNMTTEEMIAGGYKSGREPMMEKPMMDKKMMEGKDATK